jgi:ubiquinone/menaquinone biosynthesis C-methylase UbiE
MILKEKPLTGNEVVKSAVKTYWDNEPCDTRYSSNQARLLFFKELEQSRYQSQPNIVELAQFGSARGTRVLEIGVGVGVDFCNWLRNGATAVGVDFTEQAIELTKEYLRLEGQSPTSYGLLRGDAEQLPLKDESFDLVYSYGVLHHTPDTPKAFSEAFRVLRNGGQLRCMIYHSPSWVAFNLWLYHGLLKLRPWKSMKEIAFEHLESPGTKLYSVREAEQLVRCAGFRQCRIKILLHDGDLLNMKLSKKYKYNLLVRTAQKLYPRRLIRWLDGRNSRFGVVMQIEAVKGG